MKIFVAVCAAALASAAAADEQQLSATNTGAAYVAALGGVALPQHDDIENVDTVPTGVLVGGIRSHEHFAFELGVGYAREKLDLGSAHGSAFVMPITATAKVILPVWRLDLYALGGVGVYVSHIELRSRFEPETSRGDASVGFHGGAGVLLRLSEHVALTAEGRYHAASVQLLDTDTHIDHVQALGGFTIRLPQ